MEETALSKPEAMNKKVLIIDDEADLAEMMSLCLESEGFSVDMSFNGEEGLEKAQALVPDLILLDILMPEMDGWEFCRRLRANPNPKIGHIPIVVMTALQVLEKEKTMAMMDVSSVVIKPFKEEDVIQILKNI